MAVVSNGGTQTDAKLGPGKDDFYEKSVDRFSSWVQFEDAKAGAVLVLPGLGLTDILGNADALIHAHEKSSLDVIASFAFWLSIAAAAAAVGVVAYAVFPFTRSSHGSSIFYFEDVATNFPYIGKSDAEKGEQLAAYVNEVSVARGEEALERDMADQALTLAGIAAKKVRYVSLGFWSVAVFLIAWGVARIALGLG
jgi:Family of unknown function (DUF5706)